MSAFLLDANLSPKLARFLTATFGFDVESLLALGLGHLPDTERERALPNRRVVPMLHEGAMPVVPGDEATIAVQVSPDLLAITREWKPDYVQMSRSPLS